jgi:pyruvate,water dikinase
MGLRNVQVMIPFVRSVQQGKAVIDLMAKNGLVRGKDDLKVIMMSELPTNALLADQYLEHFDGMSIGSNDMTQLTIAACKAQGKYVGICGQGPSDHPDLARWLLDQGIESLSLNPDTVVETWLFLAGQTV